MLRLASILFSMVATTLSGIGVVVALTLGHDTLSPILVGAAIGFVIAFPVTYFVAKAVSELR
ncbi:CTP synthetase [Cochlodiniinecator piscidefendens]|uniref:CTP synthetase n=1 Tax=Cochlodiniinecator piscidefendens TaxID=2715756 RepID=UPI00140B2893|nr:CTP synthetase [Cochlodiniinecator piscidefendens]